MRRGRGGGPAAGLGVREGESEIGEGRVRLERGGVVQAPEQFRGSAQSKSDAYGAGATLLYLLSGNSPALLSARSSLLTRHLAVDSGFCFCGLLTWWASGRALT